MPRWRVRLRYRDGRSLPTLDRLATAEWMTAVLPEQAGIDPVCVLPVNGGWTVSLHPREPDAADALQTAIAAVCEVVGILEGCWGNSWGVT
jgi:hypothetical protein